MKQAVGLNTASPKSPHPVRHALLIGLAAIAVLVLLVAAYLVLLVGEPTEESKNTPEASMELITAPMSPVEALGSGGMASLPNTFGKPVLALSGGELEKSLVSDTAYNGSYARTAVLCYALEDGGELQLISLRPTSAAPLLMSDGNYSLVGDKLYTLAGMNAARAENGQKCIVFAQSDDAVYAAVFAPSQSERALELLHSTLLLESRSSAQ